MEQTNIEKYLHGQFSLTEEEKKKAIERGDLTEKKKKVDIATGRLRVEQWEKLRRPNKSAEPNQ